MRNKIIVLKFGSSVLQTAADLPRAVHEIYRWVRRQYGVVAVVSAFNGETDRLLDRVSSYRDAQPEAVARIVSTGEEIATASLALELDRFGLPAQVLDASQMQLIAEACGNDTEPVSVATQRIQEVLKLGRVVVVPGFVARDLQGRVALFGRGGSDLSALFLAQSLGARCRLIKDVDGIFTGDPAVSSRALRFDEITFADALSIGGRIVQPKAISFAQKRGTQFEVAELGSSRGTIVGSSWSRWSTDQAAPRPLKVGLLGLGTVGLGVYRELSKHPDWFDVTGIAVRRPERHRQQLVTSDCWSVIDGVDVVVELIGGVKPAGDLVRASLAAGKTVVTANKLLLSQNADLTVRPNIRYSAAVGGAVPALEAVHALAETEAITSLSGVLNGTCNYVLDRIAAGDEFAEAVTQAQANGFAEQDPRDDLSGSDTICKLRLLAHRAFSDAKSISVESTGIEQVDTKWVRSVAENGGRVRLVGSVLRNGANAELTVRPQSVDENHPFAQIRNEENCLVVKTKSSFDHHVWTGRGAGRWPTTTAVMADLFDIYRESRFDRSDQEVHLAAVGGAA